MGRILLLIVSIVFTVNISFAQKAKIKTSTGKYSYPVPSSMSIDEATKRAITYAKIDAINNAFGGGSVNQNNITLTTKTNETDNIKFVSHATSNLAGDWIEDIDKPKVERVIQDGQIFLIATVKGKVREVIRAKIDITAKVLRQDATLDSESTEFQSGNDFFLFFKSPQAGYLTVYLLGEDGIVYCLLPYQNSPNSVKKIEKDSEYILFDIESAEADEANFVDEYNFTVAGDKDEVNYLYIIFSPNSFAKASDKSKGELIPRQLTLEQFQEWLAENRKHDDKLQVVEKAITIKAK